MLIIQMKKNQTRSLTAHKSTQHIVWRLRELIVDYFAIEDLSAYDVNCELDEANESMWLSIQGEEAQLDFMISSRHPKAMKGGMAS